MLQRDNTLEAAWPRWLALTALLLFCGIGYAALEPAAINGDGVGYLKRIASGQLAAGHPLYVPLATLLTRDAQTALEAASTLRWLSLASILAALALFAGCCRELVPGGRWLVATALLASCFAVARSATQVEVYAPALAASVGGLYSLLRARRSPSFLLLAAAAVAVATLLHLTLALLLLPLGLLAWRWRSLPWAIGTVALSSLSIAIGVVLAARSAGHHELDAVARFYLGADHGMPYPLRLWTPLVAVWGLARSVVAAPYLHQAGPVWAGLLGGGAVSAFVALALLVGRGARRLGDLPLLLLCWCVPLTLFGLLFYPSDTERWIFVLPALGLLVSQLRWRRAWLLPICVAAVSAVHLAPRALDPIGAQRARAAETWLRHDDLVVSPGHGWSEQLGLGMRRPPRRLLLVSLLAQSKNPRRALERLDVQLRALLRAKRRVYVTRLQSGGDPRGFKELARWGLDRRRYRAIFAAFAPRPVPGLPWIWQLSRSSSIAPRR
jgi:hypothetical protein